MIEVASIWQPDIQQHNFRALLAAMSHPGQVKPILSAEDDNAATTAVLATLLDGTVSLADPDRLLDDNEWPLLQAENADPANADYILCAGCNVPELEPKLGTLASPERSATVVIQVADLTGGNLQLRLIGPGINGYIDCAPTGLNTEWLERREDWVCAFPLGVDWLLVDHSSVLAIPRTTKVEVF